MTLKKKIKAVFVDRDGTINVEKQHVYKIEDFELIPGAIEAFQLLIKDNVKIYIMTNQAGIAKGFYEEKDFRTLTEYMIQQFKKHDIIIEEVLYCPHHPEGVIPRYSIQCNCRKPNIGMVDVILKQKGLLPSDVALIGDKNSDIELGCKMGIITYLVLTGYGLEHRLNTKATYIKKNLLEATQHLLGLEA